MIIVAMYNSETSSALPIFSVLSVPLVTSDLHCPDDV